MGRGGLSARVAQPEDAPRPGQGAEHARQRHPPPGHPRPSRLGTLRVDRAPTERLEVVFQAMWIFRLEQGKIAEVWRSADDLGRVVQIGGKIVPGSEA